MRHLVYNIILFYLKIFNSIKVEGIENIPVKGPLIIASNHLSNIDPPAIISVVSRIRPVHTLAKKELFKIKIIAWFLKKFYAIPVDRQCETGDISALKAALNVLKKDGCILIFPEGTRAKGRNLKPKTGISFLAYKSGAPVLPVRIFNSEKFTKLSKIIIKFGKLIEYPLEKGKEGYDDFSLKVMNSIFSQPILENNC